MSFSGYPRYKDSGVEWLGEVPEHWEVKPLKYSCSIFPSNVDKKSHEGEIPVKLCNYTDVYYSEFINTGSGFLDATASPDQVAKFTLRAGDTIITKDSETADDIAISSYVPTDLPGVVCGYHLSMVRPRAQTHGAFVKRLFDSAYVKGWLAVRAKGLTRVGLGQYELDNIPFAVPPVSEQTQIAAFLDRETAKIDDLVAEQRRLMELLKEKRQAVISHAVTKGLNPDAPMKDSGVEWLGEVPEHWEISRLRHICHCLDSQRIPLNSAERSDRAGDIPYWGANSVVGYVNEALFDEDLVLLGEDGAPFFEWERPVAFFSRGPIWPNNHVHVLRPIVPGTGEFITHVLNITSYSHFIDGSTRDKLTQASMREIPVSLPPLPEQVAIVQFLTEEAAQIDTLTTEAQRAIDLLQERRTALISAAVTGQIDVRDIAQSEAA